MCAARTPQQGMELALAVQTALHEHDWGTDAVDAVYHDLLDTIEIGQLSNVCWNGLPRCLSAPPAPDTAWI